MADQDIVMSLNDTLELDTIIEKSTRATKPIGYDSNNFTSTGIQTHTGVLKAENTGTHTININGQELTVKVTDPNTVPDSGITRYTFDNADTGGSTSKDLWGRNNGTIFGATTGISGQINEAYSIDGTGDRVETPINPTNDLPSTGFTIGLWFKPKNWNDNDYSGIIASQDANNHLINLGQDNKGGINWLTNDGSNHGVEQANVGYSDGTWYFIVARYDSTNGYILDTGSAGGSLSQYSNSDTTLADVDEPLYIGGISRDGSFSGSDSVEGDYDDPRFYNKTLSDTEVSNWFETGSISG